MAEKVVVIGGGVAGLTAAHELQERGFEVVVYERNKVLGGKARSFGVPDTCPEKAIQGLPAEHGFRFFPGFYRHLTNTLSRIPCPESGQGNRYVVDNLINVPRCAYAQHHMPFFQFPTHLPKTLRGWTDLLAEMFGHPALGVLLNEAAFAALKLVNALTMCHERREAELDGQSWWNYMRADEMSPQYRSVIVNGLTQNFVAMDARMSSTKSVINVLARLLDDFMRGGVTMDRILNGPTSEVWIDPWVHYLETSRSGQIPVVFHSEQPVHSLVFDEAKSRVAGIRLRRKVPRGQDEGDEEDDSMPHARGDQPIESDADYFIAAVPVESMQRIIHHSPSAIRVQAPSLTNLYRDVLQTNWMSGVMYYLKEDVTMGTGHVVFLDSEWALTSISQNQFWRKKVDSYAYGKVSGILSVIISDWFTSSRGVTAQQTDNPKELADETLRQIREHLPERIRTNLEQRVVGFYLDPALEYRMAGPMPAREFASRKARLRAWARTQPPIRKGMDPTPEEFVERNLEPLFINTVDSWDARPSARVPEIDNLFLASDYVKTSTDLATMEGANEAARQAVNGILDVSKSRQLGCRIFGFDEPAFFAPFRAIDKLMYDRGFPHSGIFNTMAGILLNVAPRFSRFRRSRKGW
jgi:uncharacterized protein with NAD-binding domain and iron-sulfur cluster